jgi:hypothetical protein
VDTDRPARIRFAAELFLHGARESEVLAQVRERWGVTLEQARQDLVEVKIEARRVLGDEDSIAMFMLRKVGQLEQVGERLHADALAEDPALPESIAADVVDPMTLIQHERNVQASRSQRAQSARAFADITKVSTALVGQPSKTYGPKRDATPGGDVSPEQREALENFWRDE